MGNELTRNCSDFDCEESETHPGEPYSITYYRCPDDAEQVLNTEFNFHYPDDMSNTPQEFDGFESFKSELVGIYCRTRQDCDKAHTCLETGDLKCRTRGPVSYEYFSDYLITDGDQCEEEDDEQTPE